MYQNDMKMVLDRYIIHVYTDVSERYENGSR